jgi:hypothetical protein
MKSHRVFGVLALFCILMARHAHAAPTINLDFQPGDGSLYSGLGMAPDGNTYWNPISSSSGSNLLASDGSGTSVDVSTTYTSFYQNPGHFLLLDRGIWSAGEGNPTGNPNIPAITISDLDAGARYDVYLYAGYYNQIYTIDGVSQSLTGEGYSLAQPDWTAGVQYVAFLGVNAPGGIIDIYNTSPILPDREFTGNTVLSGLQIHQQDPATVPAPGSLILASLGLGLISRFKRK